ncbi:MAG: hypothetical protein BGO11_09980 [Solirubrobacterales bacterium 70-9]|nr:MAG: hypothetical protein BGO11_09980 [Solirubrobacterales bacterium 70-9]
MRRGGLSLALVFGLWAVITTSAAAHIQVSPTVAAPNDTVKFTVLAPGERAPHRSMEVILKVPPEVLAYSFGETPGWRRTTQDSDNGSIGTIVWKGDAEPDGFVEFSFLAATPPKPGKIAWKALQVYDDGKVVRWIGGPASESPAPVTDVRADAPLQNAGGEGADGAASAGRGTELDAGAISTNVAQSGGGGDGLDRRLAIAALVLASIALAVAVRRRG